mmetsp:Transcript_18126/g.25603  ORF Transcript_18126/g.25603 Transcript_18126/m.25603 type:complete len:383 (+) Transcript_18126:26-1174(+)|eukprot:CAMPEP_0184868994 /NCGR_PEP_ID=MMETSP0580-20130426/32449_1 /TAXON_ID=1118495 /ORGANISM="Dactyliosolen fragilissimus" /LENGTH=382 /DNA_ID=CAMNT_0027370199 /DNA_START=15 /DNA_END=1163 /DNA_ORIENTATION=-
MTVVGDNCGVQNEQYCIDFEDVLTASKRIKGIAYRTPVLTSNSLNESCPKNGYRLFFKVEAMQRTGSFKFRGALNATLNLLENIASKNDEYLEGHKDSNKTEINVVTHSSGNHAAALALAAKVSSNPKISVRATIVMPKNAPIIKKNGVKGFGGEIVLVESTNEAREEMADVIVRDRGAFFIHPSEDKNVIAGQGTASLEFVEQVREIQSNQSISSINENPLDVVIIPVGGGGLASGSTIALRGLFGDNIKVILAEPSEMDDAKRSKDAGKLLGHDADNKLQSVADGLKTTLGPNTWPIVRDLVDDIFTVTEEEILFATKIIWERLKICIEPSAGVGVAVALKTEFAEKYTRINENVNVGVILCGGNVDIIKLGKLWDEKEI